MNGPIQPHMIAVLNSLASALDDMFNGTDRSVPKKTGFVVLTFTFDVEGAVNYISNAKREDMIASMKEFIARHEGRFHEASAASHERPN